MVMARNYTIDDVTKDLSFVLSLTGALDANDKGVVVPKGQEEPFVYRLENNDPGKNIILFQDPLPQGDYYLFNPFGEGFGKETPASKLFYKLLRESLNVNIATVLLYILQSNLEAKQAAKEKKEYSISSTVLKMSSVLVDKKNTIYDVVDETLLEEAKTLLKRCDHDLINVVYLSRQMTAQAKCPVLTDPLWDEKFTKDIRKKSINAFKAALMGILGIETVEDLNTFKVKYDPELKSSAQFHTTLALYLKLYAQFNEILGEAFGTDGESAQSFEINLGELTNVIERLPLAYAIAKHTVQPVLPARAGPTSFETADTSRFTPQETQKPRPFGPKVLDSFGSVSTPVSPVLSLTPQPQASRFGPKIINDPNQNWTTAQQAAVQHIPVQQIPVQPVSNFGYPQGGFYNQPLSLNQSLNLNPPNNFGLPGTGYRW